MSFVTRLVNDPLNKLLFLPAYHVDYGFFSNDDVRFINEYCSTLAMSDGKVFDEKDVYKTRKAKTAFISKPDGSNQWIYDKLNNLIGYYNDTLFGFELTGYQYIQYTEYDANGKHEFHMDIALGNRTVIDYRMNESMRKLSIVLLLNEPGVDFEGGQFHLNTSEERLPEVVPLQKGSVVMFPSFLIHRVTPVTSGIRKTLVTWVIGPKFR